MLSALSILRSFMFDSVFVIVYVCCFRSCGMVVFTFCPNVLLKSGAPKLLYFTALFASFPRRLPKCLSPCVYVLFTSNRRMIVSTL